MTPDEAEALVKRLEGVQHSNPNHPRGIGYNEAVTDAIAIVREFAGETQPPKREE